MVRALCEKYDIDITFSKLGIKITKYEDGKVFRQIYPYIEMDFADLNIYDLVDIFLEKYCLQINQNNI